MRADARGGPARADAGRNPLHLLQCPRPRALVHVVGERPGSGHHSFSAYLTAPAGRVWAGQERPVDHDITRVIAGISDTSVRPEAAAREAVRILGELCRG